VEPTGAWTQNKVTQNYSMGKALIKFGLLNYSSLYITGLMEKDFELVNYIQTGPNCPSKVCAGQEHNSCSKAL